MNRCLLIIFCWSLFCMAFPGRVTGQVIQGAEYFIDNDPGVGNGMPLAVNTTDSLNATLNFSTAGLPLGRHFLYVRVKDTSGIWSLYQRRLFMVDVPNELQKIQAVEYYMDTVLPVGHGHRIEQPLTDSLHATFPDDSNSPGLGRHFLYVRVQANNGLWSHYKKGLFMVDEPKTEHLVTEAEYYIDEDPGIDSATTLAITPAHKLDLQTSAKTDTLPIGNYRLGIRVRNDSGSWSLTREVPFNVCSEFGPLAQFDWVLNGDTAYFNNSSQYTAESKWVFGDGQTNDVAVNPAHYFAPGQYEVCLQASNICGSDTLCRLLEIRGIDRVTPTAHANDGFLVMDIFGGGLETQSTAFLTKGTDSIVAREWTFINSTQAKAIFRLRSEPLGHYDLVVEGNSGARDTLTSAIDLEAAKPFDLYTELNGHSQILVNRNWNYSLTVGNKGNRTAFGVPVYIQVSPNAEVTASMDFLTDSFPQYVIDSFPHFNMFHDTIAQDSVLLGAFMIPVIGPGQSKVFRFRVKPTALGTVSITHHTADPWVETWQLDSIYRSSCTGLPACAQCALDILGTVPALGCGISLFNLGCSIGNNINEPSGSNALDLVGSIGGAILSCSNPVGGLALQLAGQAAGTAGAISGASSSCGPGGCNPKPKKEEDINSVGSFDPNAKEGPVGVGSERYITGDHPITYTIYFENLDTATAPASQVIINDSIDTSVFDLSTLTLVEFGLADTVFEMGQAAPPFVTDIDLRPERQTILRMHTTLDTSTGLLQATFTSLEPDTMQLVEDVTQGFLPPNVNAPEGEGYVRFRITPRPGLQHADLLANEAEIIFDANEPIETPTWQNVIDREAPQSAVDELPGEWEDTLVTLLWSGTDAESGILEYALYVSEDGGPFMSWRTTRGTEATFRGEFGKSYQFYSIATDKVGNEELPPPNPDINPDAEIALVKPSGMEAVNGAGFRAAVQPNPATQQAWLTIDVDQPGTFGYHVVSPEGRKLLSKTTGTLPAGRHRITLPLEHIPAGIYVVQVQREGASARFVRLSVVK